MYRVTENPPYEILIDECRGRPSAVIQWLQQVQGKTWASRELIDDLVKAFTPYVDGIGFAKLQRTRQRQAVPSDGGWASWRLSVMVGHGTGTRRRWMTTGLVDEKTAVGSYQGRARHQTQLWTALLLLGGVMGCQGSVDVGDPTNVLVARDTDDASTQPPGKPGTGLAGSRLKRWVIVADDGTTVEEGLHDTGLDVDCYFRVASDGVLRCLPSRAGGSTDSYYGPFEDPDCSHPCVLVPHGDACSAPQYALGTKQGACPYDGTDRTHVFLLGEKITKVYVRYTAESPCTEATSQNGEVYYQRGPEVPPETFVGATRTLED